MNVSSNKPVLIESSFEENDNYGLVSMQDEVYLLRADENYMTEFVF